MHMTRDLLRTMAWLCTMLALMACLLMRSRIDEAKVREEGGIAARLRLDPLRLPARLLTREGVWMKRLSLAFIASGVAAAFASAIVP